MEISLADNTVRKERLKVTGFDVLRVILGVVLLVAAGLKGYQITTEPMPGKGLFASRWFLIAEVEFELTLGVFLLSGLYKRLLWLVTVLCFTGFAGITLYKALTGQASCGCFGRVEINPWYTFFFDLAAVCALMIFRLPGNHFETYRFLRPRFVVTCLLVVLLALPSGYAMAQFTPAQLADNGFIEGKGNFVVLEPEKWLGKSFPLIKHINIGDQLSKGRWIIVLYHEGCANCQEVISECLGARWAKEARLDLLQTALIEVPTRQATAPPRKSTFSCRLGKLASTKEWFVQTPQIILLTNGIAKAITTKKVSIDELLGRVQMKGGDAQYDCLSQYGSRRLY